MEDNGATIPMPALAPETGLNAPVGSVTERPVLFRPNVAAILLNMDNEMLVAERAHIRGSWQFPQGGVDPGETLEEALLREIEEEIGVKPKQVQVLDRKGGYRYEFPKGRLKYGIYGGQEQVYFLCRFLGHDEDISIDTKHREFGRWRWLKPDKFDMDWVPKFKRDVYRRVLRDFFGIDR
jgi:putative (di)nucleoside polyphosphate hydrolase